jgi:ATP adenylyltransferase
MLERIWSGWRSSYVDGASVRRDDGAAGASPPAGSVFTQLLESGEPDEATHVVHRSDTCFVVVNIFPYTSGHVLVVPYREVADLDGLTPAETADLWATVTRTVTVVRHAYRPDGMNVGLNLGRPSGGSVPEHLHVHVVPRWTGDSNFLTAISNTQTLPESIHDTAARLRRAWTSLG